jgi:hypothetical protein
MKDNIINKVIQARTIEATKENINAKLICIARNYGSPVIGNHYDSPLVNEDWFNFNDASVDWAAPDEADDGNLPRLGYIYDSLKLGVNLEIVVMAREIYDAKTGKKELEKPTKVRCSYNGYMVYLEEENKLCCYAPFPEWLSQINKIYNQATGADRRRTESNKKEENKVKKKATQKALSTLRRLWGI